ncbi:MAG: hypothetical protein CVT77_18900 [Alphaproteobacteria bacterium HGW-Alphaproteobacteria-16]|nr:MAG: hypothetical protein CVT77_18900 [Alphaproteobacteria bacterium HGW-Alphaproteobacteria-16]
MASKVPIGQRDQMSDDPSPDVRLPSGTTGRLLASIGNLSTSLGAIHSRFAQHHDLGPRGIWIMSWISEGHGNPGAIARAMILPPSVISGDLNRLTDRELIVRQRGAADGRRLVYSLTATGRALLAEAHGNYLDLLQDKLASYPPEQLDAMLRMLFEISRHVRTHLDESER